MGSINYLVTSILQNIFHMSCFALDHLSMYMTYFLYLSVQVHKCVSIERPMEHTYNIQYSFYRALFTHFYFQNFALRMQLKWHYNSRYEGKRVCVL